MKKTLKVMAMVLFVVSMVSLTSCKKEKANLIVGKWECTSASYTQAGITQSIPWLNGMVWEFKANGTLIGSIPDDLVESDDDAASATYVVSGDVLTVSYVDEDDGDIERESYAIKELTETKLVLEETEDGVTATLEFKKI